MELQELSERLRYFSLVMFSAHEKNVPMSVWENDPPMIAEAATQLDALAARVKELEHQLRTSQSAAKTLLNCQGTELEHLRQNKTFDHKLRSEHESLLARDAMMTEALEAAESRATRAEQERDGAYERAAEAVRISPPLDHNGYVVSKDVAIKAIRRLPAGPEKERSHES